MFSISRPQRRFMKKCFYKHILYLNGKTFKWSSVCCCKDSLIIQGIVFRMIHNLPEIRYSNYQASTRQLFQIMIFSPRLYHTTIQTMENPLPLLWQNSENLGLNVKEFLFSQAKLCSRTDFVHCIFGWKAAEQNDLLSDNHIEMYQCTPKYETTNLWN